MKIVLDTNVLISGVLSSGPPSKILAAWNDGHIEFVITNDIYDEYKRVAIRLEQKIKSKIILPVVDHIVAQSKIYPSIEFEEQISDDPGDDKFITASLVSKAKVIVSGDKHLLDLNAIIEVNVLYAKEIL